MRMPLWPNLMARLGHPLPPRTCPRGSGITLFTETILIGPLPWHPV